MNISIVLHKFDFESKSVYSLKKIILLFASHFNYSVNYFILEELKNISFSDFILSDNRDFETEISSHILTSVANYFSIFLIKPASKSFKKSEFFLKAFDINIWLLHIIFSIFLSLILKIVWKKFIFFKCMIKIFTSMTTGQLYFPRSQSRIRRIYIFICFYGMMFSMFYSTILGSFLVESPDSSNFKYICTKARIKALKSCSSENINFIYLGNDNYYGNFLSLNRNFGYCVTSMTWDNNNGFLNVKPRIFKKLATIHRSFQYFSTIRKDFKHIIQYNKFEMLMYSSGLVAKWSRDEAISSFTFHRYLILNINQKLTIKNFKNIFMIYILCNILGYLLFVFEWFSYLIRNYTK